MSKRRKKQRPQSMYHPSYWLTWLGIGIIKLITLLPFNVQLGIGKVLGRVLLNVAKSRRHITETNIRLCFPELNAQEQRLLVRKTFESQAIGLIETAYGWFTPVEKMRHRVTVHNHDIILDAAAKGNGVLLLGGHYTTLDIIGTMLSLFCKYDVIYRMQKNPVLEHIMTSSRQRYLQGGDAISQSDMRGVYRALNAGRTVWYPPDQDYGGKHSEFVDFFGIKAATIKAPSRMIKKCRPEVVMLHHYRDENNHYHIHFTDGSHITGENSFDDCQAINQHLEKVIRAHPEQYMWVHRRFKSRPEGEPSVYKKHR